MLTALNSAINVINAGISFLSPMFRLLGATVNNDLLPALRYLWAQLGPILGPTVRILAGIIGGVLVVTIGVLTGTLVFASKIIAGFANALGFAINVARNFVATIRSVASSVPRTISQGVQSAVNAVWEFYGRFVDAGWGLMKALANGIKGAAMVPYNAAKEALNKVKNLLPGSDAKEGPLSKLTHSGKMFSETFAKGITSSKGSIYDAASSSLTVPSMGLNNSSNTTQPTKVTQLNAAPVNITIQAGAFMGSEVEARKFATQILGHLKDVAAAKGTNINGMMA